MLAYAFQLLKEDGYSNIAAEKFENTADLLSAILAKGISIQVKRGLNREYVETKELLSGVRGKIDVTDSIKKQTFINQKLVCDYDEFSVNSYKNQIIKTTVGILLRYDIPLNRKKELRNLMPYFRDVETLDPHGINWNIQYNRNNQTYQMLISICYLVIKGLLQATSDGHLKLMSFFDEQRMCRLYEKFILEYFKKEYSQEIKTAASQIDWALDDGISTMLPIMQSDIMLSYEDRTLIIDAKYYEHTMQLQYDIHTIHSNNLYQIFTYVKNKSIRGGTVSGMLLYAKTDEEIQPNQQFKMSGNIICVRTLDLDCDFSHIKEQLDNIAEDFMSGKI